MRASVSSLPLSWRPAWTLVLLSLSLPAVGACGDDDDASTVDGSVDPGEDAGADAAAPDAAAVDAGEDAGSIPTGPSVVRTIPADGATDVVTDLVLEVELSEPMDRASTEAAFSLEADGAAVTGTFAWDGDDTILRFTPGSSLAANTEHLLTLEGTARGRSGDALTPANVRFRTGESMRGEPSSNWDEAVWDFDVWE